MYIFLFVFVFFLLFLFVFLFFAFYYVSAFRLADEARTRSSNNRRRLYSWPGAWEHWVYPSAHHRT
jgi:hypothetical protein